MANGIFVAASGATTRLLEMDVLSNNLANVNTVGYKRDSISFEEAAPEQTTGAVTENDKRFVRVTSSATDFSQGSLLRTDNKLDIALRGSGFLRISTEEGDRLTRDGRLMVGQDGTLRHTDGFQVLDERGDPIFLPPERVPEISPDGQIMSGDLRVAKLGLVHPDLTEGLERDASGFFKVPTEDKLLGDVTSEVVQGHVEAGNASAISSMVELIELQRSFEAMHQVISAYKEMDDSAVRLAR